MKTFEDLVLEYDVSIKDMRKYNSLMNGILLDWFDYPLQVQESMSDEIVETLFVNVKVTKSSYNLFKSQEIPVNAENFWIEALDIGGGDNDNDWAAVHSNNFNCNIETQIRAFYFKIFHMAICTNKFLHKIGRTDSPLFIFVKNLLNFIFICFVTVKKVLPLWNKLSTFFDEKCCENLDFSNFQKMFDIDILSSEHSMVINLKFYIYRCKFQQCIPNFKAFLKLTTEKVNFRSQILECPSIGQYWDIFGVPVLPENVILTFFRTC